jgi:hypothetical protein
MKRRKQNEQGFDHQKIREEKTAEDKAGKKGG